MTPDHATPALPAEKSALPVVALVLAIVGLCLPFLLPIALILAIVSLAKASEPAFAPRKGLAIAALVVPLAYIPIAGILAAIAIPNFIKFQSRSKQSECKSNLKSAYFAERSYMGEQDKFSTSPSEVGFSPERGNRYLYLFSADGAVVQPGEQATGDEVGVGPDTQRYPEADARAYAAALPADLERQLGVQGTCPECMVTVACVGNIDNDATLDVWSVSSEDRKGPDGERVAAGTPMHHVDDVTD